MANPSYTVRKVTEADLTVLTEIKQPTALHRDRLLAGDGEKMLYLVVERPDGIVGFGLLVFERPASWPDADDTSRLPAMVDLLVRPDCRGQGAGSHLIGAMEDTARARGCSRLHMGADPIDNPRAYELYLRLGYRRVQDEPYRSHWKFTDSDGNLHEGSEWQVDMVKDLRETTG